MNKFTAITTTGMAYINDKNIADIVEEFKATQQDIEDLAISFDEKIEQLQRFINEQIREHLSKYPTVGYTLFVVTYYEKHTHKTFITEVSVNENTSDTLADANYDYTTAAPQLDWITVVCEGQNKISEKVLYGTGRELYTIFDTFVANILSELQLPPGTVPDNFVETLRNKQYFNNIFYGDFELLNLQDLSLQQAVDLACLLMRLEVDFQKYTKNVPTVGGVIKLAVINEKGFKFLSGDEIEVPKHINY